MPRLRQGHPLPGGGIADDVEWRRGRPRALVRAEQEEEPVARVQYLDLPLHAASGEEGEGGVHRRRATVSTGRSDGRGRQAGEAPGGAVGDEEEAGEGLREPGAVGGVGDEAMPAPGHALEAAERPGRQTREDVDGEVVREVGRRRCARLHVCGESGYWNRTYYY